MSLLVHFFNVGSRTLALACTVVLSSAPALAGSLVFDSSTSAGDETYLCGVGEACEIHCMSTGSCGGATFVAAAGQPLDIHLYAASDAADSTLFDGRPASEVNVFVGQAGSVAVGSTFEMPKKFRIELSSAKAQSFVDNVIRVPGGGGIHASILPAKPDLLPATLARGNRIEGESLDGSRIEIELVGFAISDPTSFVNSTLAGEGLASAAFSDVRGSRLPDFFEAADAVHDQYTFGSDLKLGELVDSDEDGDGVPYWGLAGRADWDDNCRDDPNPDQADLDRDGYGDACDGDDDGDLWYDDTEILCGSDALDPESTPGDMDYDGVCDARDDDGDGDGWSNRQEADCGTDATDPAHVPLDENGDGRCDTQQRVLEDMCDYLDCSGNGTCRVVDDQPECACEAGFEFDGTTCVEEAAAGCSAGGGRTSALIPALFALLGLICRRRR